MKAEFWRNVEEYTASREIEELVHREFPALASEFTDPVGRRRFLQVMGASLALAGAGACTRQPDESIVPYVRQPEEIIPGRPLYFATAIPEAGVAMPVLVESQMGRPTKIEGNPEHPASLGATDARTQAAILTLYDPDRAQTITYRGDVRPWGSFLAAMQLATTAQRSEQGAGLRILTRTTTSPTLADQLDALLKELPQAKWHQWEPAGRAAPREQLLYRFDRADVVLSLDADFLGCGPGQVRYARDFAMRRRVDQGSKAVLRLYAVESCPTITGAKADHRVPMRASDIVKLAQAVDSGSGEEAQVAQGRPVDWPGTLINDLQAHAGRSIVIAGDTQPPEVHAAARRINERLGNMGSTVIPVRPIEPRAVDHVASIRELTAEMAAGKVDVLVIIGGNPVFDAPADLKFADALRKAGQAVHVGLYADETSELCHWNIPLSHALESWSDARAYDGTVSIIQPLIAPLYGTRTAHEVIAALTARPERSSYEIVREYWLKTRGLDEKAWRRALHDGFVANSEGAFEAPRPEARARSEAPPRPEERGTARGPRHEERGTTPEARGTIEIQFRPDPTIGDGQLANNGWLQELPKPLTKLTWDSAAYISPKTAERIGVVNTDVVELRANGRSIRMPIWIVPGHAHDAVTVHLGYGRRRAGRVGTRVGFDAYPLRTSDALWTTRGEIVKTGETYPLATTQSHFLMENRNVVRVATVEEYRREPEIISHMGHTPPKTLTLYPEHEYTGNKWGMAIDLNSCTGCNACMVACQAENNVPVVGKDQVMVNREMHWLRVDTYYRGDLDNPETYHQPVPCMQCENAPCEVVCPVAATTHSSEGLNDMVYNRCVGTRYCSNNCPYKVRRFNFLLYSDWNTESYYSQRNPDVTVRSRGVMEKCTYCVQRVNQARIELEKLIAIDADDATPPERREQNARTRHRLMRELQTASQQSCPTEAIVFGDLHYVEPDGRKSRVA
ncbi:MAG: TAT-variant-translocated molybdopterin oxidoreductase, partial [Vicinamibacterales bacterium]